MESIINIRKAVPLALALLCISDPKVMYLCMKAATIFASCGKSNL